MCGSLRLEEVDKKIGNLVTVVRKDGTTTVAPWHGFIRSERGLLDQSDPRNQHIAQEIVTIPASSYNEKGVEFQVPQGMKIEAVLTTRPGFSGVFIRTRDATKEELKRCKHNRHPRLVK